MNRSKFNKDLKKATVTGAIGLGMLGIANIAKPTSAGARTLSSQDVYSQYDEAGVFHDESYVPSSAVYSLASSADSDANSNYHAPHSDFRNAHESYEDPITHNTIHEFWDDDFGGGQSTIDNTPDDVATNLDTSLIPYQQSYYASLDTASYYAENPSESTSTSSAISLPTSTTSASSSEWLGNTPSEESEEISEVDKDLGTTSNNQNTSNKHIYHHIHKATRQAKRQRSHSHKTRKAHQYNKKWRRYAKWAKHFKYTWLKKHDHKEWVKLYKKNITHKHAKKTTRTSRKHVYKFHGKKYYNYKSYKKAKNSYKHPRKSKKNKKFKKRNR